MAESSTREDDIQYTPSPRKYRVVDSVGETDWDDGPLMSRTRDWDDWDNPDPSQHPARRLNIGPSPQQERPSTRRSREPDRYDGSTPWIQYAAHFDAISNINGWSDVEASRQLAASLRGSACRVLYPKPTQYGRAREFTLHELVGRLNRRYGPGHLADNYLSMLKSRQQRQKETLPELAEDVQDLTLKAYPEAEVKFLDRLTIMHFRDAIREPDIREAVHRSKPASLDDALAAALEAENWKQLESKRGGTSYVRQVTAPALPIADPNQQRMDALQSDVKQLAEMMANFMTAEKRKPRGGARPRRPLICWTCQQPGHKANVCPGGAGGNPSAGMPPPPPAGPPYQQFGPPPQITGNDPRPYGPWSPAPMGPPRQ